MHTLMLAALKALNKAFLNIKPNPSYIEDFKKNLIQILDSITWNVFIEKHKIELDCF